MSRLIQAAVAPAAGAPLSVRELTLADPGPGEVMVRIVACGLCHTDEKARHGQMPLPLPAVLGHEGAGIVETTGPGVERYRAGDRVLIGWPFCGQCDACSLGEPRYCADLKSLAFSGHRPTPNNHTASAYQEMSGKPIHGHFFGQSSLSSHSLVSANALVPVPEDFPLESAGPLACGLATGAGAVFNSLAPRKRIAIVGAGAVGFGALMAARVEGWQEIIVIDQHADRLTLARELGATEIRHANGSDLPTLIGAKVDAIIDCTGNVSLIEQAIDCIGPLGTCLLLGGAPAGETFRAEQFGVLWGKRIQGVLGGGGTSEALLGRLMALHLDGEFPFERLLTYYPLSQINQAIEDSHSGNVIKPVIRMP